MLKQLTTLLALAALAGTAHAQVQVRDAWIRGMVAGQDVTGAFMRLTSKADAKLVGVKTPAAGMTDIHQTTMHGGVMRMLPVEALELPAGKTVELKPGGYHVMLMHVAHPLKAGEKVPLTLVVEGKDGKRESVTVQVPVKALATPAR